MIRRRMLDLSYAAAMAALVSSIAFVASIMVARGDAVREEFRRRCNWHEHCLMYSHHRWHRRNERCCDTTGWDWI